MTTLPSISTDRRGGLRPPLSLARRLLAVLLPLVIIATASGRQDHRNLTAQGLEEEFFTAEGLGVRFNPPAGAVIQVQRGQDSVAVTMIDGTDVPAWSLRIRELQSSLPDPTAGRQIDALLESWRSADRNFRVLSNRPVTYGDRIGQLCYILPEADDGDAMVAGWLMIVKEDRSVLVFAMQFHANDFDRLQDLMEASFSTLRIFAPREIADSRKSRLARGEEILAAVTPERLRAIASRDQWFRFYLPSTAGGGKSDHELGYYRLRLREGMLGEIEPARDQTSYDASQKVFGLLVSVDGHYLETESKTTYDSVARYWVAWDRSQEAWSVRGTRRQGSRTLSEAQTGIRPPRSVGEPRGTLTVISSHVGGSTRDQQSWQVPEIYLSQATRWALPMLLPRDRREPILFSTYCFDPTAPVLAISLRIDEWQPVESGFGAWMLNSRSRSDALRVISIHDSAGRLLRRTWNDGRVTEPIELDQLRRLWKSKGLETGPMGGR